MTQQSIIAKEHLGSAYRIDQQINSKLLQVQSYRELATRTTGVISDARRSSSPELQKTAELVAKIVDMENEINTQIDELIDLKATLATEVARIENVDCRLLLEFRYLCFLTWEQIAVELNISLVHVHRLHGQALNTFFETCY